MDKDLNDSIAYIDMCCHDADAHILNYLVERSFCDMGRPIYFCSIRSRFSLPFSLSMALCHSLRYLHIILSTASLG